MNGEIPIFMTNATVVVDPAELRSARVAVAAVDSGGETFSLVVTGAVSGREAYEGSEQEVRGAKVKIDAALRRRHARSVRGTRGPKRVRAESAPAAAADGGAGAVHPPAKRGRTAAAPKLKARKAAAAAAAAEAAAESSDDDDEVGVAVKAVAHLVGAAGGDDEEEEAAA